MEAFDLSVGASPVGPGGEVADAVLVAQLAQRAVPGVDEPVVGHESFWLDPVLGEEGERTLEERRDGCCAFVVEQFGIAEA